MVTVTEMGTGSGYQNGNGHRTEKNKQSEQRGDNFEKDSKSKAKKTNFVLLVYQDNLTKLASYLFAHLSIEHGCMPFLLY